MLSAMIKDILYLHAHIELWHLPFLSTIHLIRTPSKLPLLNSVIPKARSLKQAVTPISLSKQSHVLQKAGVLTAFPDYILCPTHVMLNSRTTVVPGRV